MTPTRVLAACSRGGAGDLLAALPAVNALHRHFGVPVDVLATPYASSILFEQPSVGTILTDDGSEPAASLVERLRSLAYSHAVVFWSDPRISKALWQARIPVRVGQSRRLYSWRYTKRVGVRSESGDTHSHWTDIQMDYARALGATPIPTDFTVVVQTNAQDEREAEVLIARTVGDRPFIILHAARGITAHAARWPSAHFAAVGDALAGALGVPVILTGDRKEALLAAQTLAAMRQPAYDASGATSLRGFAALARRAMVVVALDSGPMHIAASVGAPTVGIFALRTDLPDRWRPLGPRVELVLPSYPCPPLCRKETCRTFACYAALDAASVVAAARRVLHREDAAEAS
jgi:ADP-heptose:LPS heptosyltransferase